MRGRITLATYTVHFQPGNVTVQVPGGTLLVDAATQAGFSLNQPCGGQGRCGRCAVIVDPDRSAVRRRSTLRLSKEDVAAGYVLACQTVVEGDAWVEIPRQEAIERRLVTHKAAARIEIPFAYDHTEHQSVQRYFLRLDPPDLSDQTDDWARVVRGLAHEGVRGVEAGLPVLRTLGRVLRQAEWEVTAVVSHGSWDRPDGPPRLLALLAGDQTGTNYGVAVDIGTTTVSVWLVDLLTGEVVAQAADYNGQIARGEDVISRIIYASKGNNLAEMQSLVAGTINKLVDAVCTQAGTRPHQVMKATIAGNTTMIHLLLAVPPEPIRLSPFVPVVNHVPVLRASELGLNLHPEAEVDCLPGVASYVGADITAGVLSTHMDEAEELTL
ncbi:MAG TPA: 2Fe-2S iron-sulfur cluster-binding protein, partial [Anaerolineae bacterium]